VPVTEASVGRGSEEGTGLEWCDFSASTVVALIPIANASKSPKIGNWAKKLYAYLKSAPRRGSRRIRPNSLDGRFCANFP
jgi:hypothetical protein